MNNTATTLRQYAFGTGPYAGIACLTGEAGCEIDSTLTLAGFKDVIASYLNAEEDVIDAGILKEFADEDYVAELHAQWSETLAGEPTVLSEYAFGGPGTYGIGCIAGDDGSEIDRTLTLEGFDRTIAAHLEYDGEEALGTRILRQFADKKYVAELYAQWRRSL